jgi:hypothetical protein
MPYRFWGPADLVVSMLKPFKGERNTFFGFFRKFTPIERAVDSQSSKGSGPRRSARAARMSECQR